MFVDNGKRNNDGYYYESNRTRIFVNGNLEKLIKFRRVATIEGRMIEYFYGDILYIASSCSEEFFYRMSGSNFSICLYFLKKAKPILGYSYVRKLSYRYLRRYYPEELL